MEILGQEKGMVLLLVLTVVALLAALVSEFAFSSLIDLRLAETYRDSSRAYYLARGGVRAAQMILKDDHNRYDARNEMWAQGVANFPIGGGVITITIEDLDGRLDINSLVSSGSARTEQKERFLSLFKNLSLEEPENLVAALIDWLDSNDVPYAIGAVGAESSYYLSLDPSYQARNSEMISLEELALVKGFTPEVIERIRRYVTVDGSIEVNINTAPAEVIATLAAVTTDPVARKDAENLVEFVKQTPLKDSSDFQKAFKDLYFQLPTGSGLGLIKYTSDYYRIRSQAWINDGTSVVTAVVRKSSNSILYLRVD